MVGAISQKLWEHSDPTSTRTFEFKRLIETKYNTKLQTYENLRLWSINNLNPFWEEVWHFTGIKASTPFSKVGSSDYLQFKLVRASSHGFRCFRKQTLLEFFVHYLVILFTVYHFEHQLHSIEPT